MPRARQLTELAGEIHAAFTVDDEMQHAMGAAGKSGALDAAEHDVGPDRVMSGFGRASAKLGAGYDLGDPVLVHLRPEGLWILSEDGRRRSGEIHPKASRRRGDRRPRGRAAVGAGDRFVAVGRYRPSRGLNTITDALELMDERVPEAIADQIVTRLRYR